ncbi:MAG: Flp pilus assembly protein CpaB [Actinomycetota bacterium]
MSSRRTLILIGAIVIGIFAGVALLNYVRGIEDDIAAEKQSVDVLVAIQDIPKGTPASEAVDMMAVAQIPLELRPNNFVPVDARDALVGLEAQNNIAKNQIIINGLFVDPTVVQQKFTDQIPSGQVAISLSIDQVAGVAGFVQPGDEVNLLIKHTTACGAGGEEEDAENPDEESTPTGPVEDEEPELGEYCTYTTPARYFFQRVEVLSVGANLQLAPGETSTQGITQVGGPMTFMVPSEAAQLLASVAEDAIYLTLLPEDYQAEPLPALTDDLMNGPTPAELAECLTPYGADGYIAGDAVDGGETVADTDETVVEHFTCAALWEN